MLLIVGKLSKLRQLPPVQPRDRRPSINIGDEDFLLCRTEALKFLRMWHGSRFQERYRLDFQTNPVSLLNGAHVADEIYELLKAVKPRVQVGGESFNPQVLDRWHKRHNPDQLRTVIRALDGLDLPYAVFLILGDYETTAEELIDSLGHIYRQGLNRPNLAYSVVPLTIPEYGTILRRQMEFEGKLPRNDSDISRYIYPDPGLCGEYRGSNGERQGRMLCRFW